jgi:flagellar hook-associated protein 3 FlgL
VNIRVTTQSQTNNAIAYMRQRADELAMYQNQVASGYRVQLPSDDPGSFAALSQAKAASARLDAYNQNVSASTAVLNNSVSTLQDVNSVLVQANQIALQGADAASSTDPTSNEALASQVDGLIDQALRDANAQPDGKSLFGGTATGAQPFAVTSIDAAGRPLTIGYNGSNQRANVITGPNQTVDTRYDGSKVFQQAGGDVFQALISLRDQLRDTTLTGPARAAAFQQRISDLGAARDAVGQTTAEQSASLATLQSVQNLNSLNKTSADQQVGDIAGTDYADAVVKMQEQQTALQAIYATTAKLLQQGLLNYIQ